MKIATSLTEYWDRTQEVDIFDYVPSEKLEASISSSRKQHTIKMSTTPEKISEPVPSKLEADFSISDKEKVARDSSDKDKTEPHDHSKGSILQGTLQGTLDRELTYFERKASLINE